jgi:tRNA(Ile)-lysidine synthase
VGLAFRADPTNLEPGYARNVLRHEVLPRVEAAVAPGARAALVRLARLARAEEEAWAGLLPGLLEGVVETSDADRIVLARPAFLAYPWGVRARLLRELVRRFGSVLDEAGTRAALEFTSTGASGRRLSLPRGLILAREFDALALFREETAEEEQALEIARPGEGSGGARLARRSYRVTWTRSGTPDGTWSEVFASDRLSFPLRLRGWAPGDRIRLSYGTKKVAKLLAEARVPAGERARRPVLEDARGRVLWVPGLARSDDARPAGGAGEGEARLIIGVTEDDTA